MILFFSKLDFYQGLLIGVLDAGELHIRAGAFCDVHECAARAGGV